MVDGYQEVRTIGWYYENQNTAQQEIFLGLMETFTSAGGKVFLDKLAFWNRVSEGRMGNRGVRIGSLGLGVLRVELSPHC